jgi:YD repeat-containing protein
VTVSWAAVDALSGVGTLSARIASGNLLTDGVNTYTYDAENRISTVNGTGAAYTYDAEGNRVQKQAGSATTDYFWSAGQVLAEDNATNNIWTDYIFAGLTNWTPDNGCAAQLETNSANAHSGSNYVQVSASSGAMLYD